MLVEKEKKGAWLIAGIKDRIKGAVSYPQDCVSFRDWRIGIGDRSFRSVETPTKARDCFVAFPIFV